ncbi:unnamed protein product [Angiostrongylus costaricensis]|uniref:UBX domain-containing protein n=1 Tax=Angiostrongylus costaricensis TaxID=334426 RepID=A0A158PJQ3_ANGCS|nr:unnamed protein product [Angiostrongylus costaricensis]
MLDDFGKDCGKIGIPLNLTKTMFMKNGLVSHAPFTLNGTNVSECSSYVYLGGEINMMNHLAPELSIRKRAAWGAFKSIEDVVKRTKNIRLRAHLFDSTEFGLWSADDAMFDADLHHYGRRLHERETNRSGVETRIIGERESSNYLRNMVTVDSNIDNFKEFCGVTEDHLALRFLHHCNGDLQAAVQLYFQAFMGAGLAEKVFVVYMFTPGARHTEDAVQRILADNNFNKTLNDFNMILWGADPRSKAGKDGTAARKMNISTFPCFVALSSRDESMVVKHLRGELIANHAADDYYGKDSIRVLVRYPSGETSQHRFSPDENTQSLFGVIFAKPCCPDYFEAHYGFPRRRLDFYPEELVIFDIIGMFPL